MGADISAEVNESKEICGKFLLVFGKHYALMYTVALMKICQKQLEKEAKGNPWKLMKLTYKPPAPTQLTGNVRKLSKYLKKWNPRFIICKSDYIIDYFESEEKFNAGAKPLGSINMSNKNLNRDANDTVLNRIIALAEKCKINIDDMPKPEKYPDFTLEIWHERKGPIYIQCEDADQLKKWCDIIEKCRWNSPRYDQYEDKANVFAFPIALWRSRWECDMWGWWWGGGGEKAMLVDAINDKIADVVMCKLDAKLTMPWAARSRIRSKFTTTVDGFVTSAVGPMWSAAYGAVEKARDEMQAKIKEQLSPIVDMQISLKAEILKMVEAGAKDFLAEKVTPHLAPLLDIVFSPIIDAFRILQRSFDQCIEKGKAKYETHEKRVYMVNNYGYNSEYWDAERKMWDLYDPLWDMRRVFDDIYPWNITGRARRRLRKTLNNALFTFETIYEDGKATGKSFDEAAAEARELMIQDSRTAVMRVLGHLLFGCVENFFEKSVIRLSRKLVAPLADKIPEVIKNFVDPEDMLESLLYDLLRACCGLVFAPFAAKIDLGGSGASAGAVVQSRAAPAPAPVAAVAPAPAPAPAAAPAPAPAPAAAPAPAPAPAAAPAPAPAPAAAPAPAPTAVAHVDPTPQPTMRGWGFDAVPADGEIAAIAIRTVPIPTPGAGEVRVKIVAACTNPVDWKHASFGDWPKYPSIYGVDGAGTVDAVGAGVTSLKAGDRVHFFGDVTSTTGAFAEYSVVRAAAAVRIPSNVSFDDAAVVPCAGWTAYEALFRRFYVEAGKVLVVNAAAGGVGNFAVQLALHAKLQVVAIVSGKEWVAKYKAMGCALVVDYRLQNAVEQVMTLTNGKGADYVLDSIDEASAKELIQCLAFTGQIAHITGTITPPEAGLFHNGVTTHHIFIPGHFFYGDEGLAWFAQVGQEFAALLASGVVKPYISKTVSFDEVRDALVEQKSGRVKGKILVKIA